MRFMSTNLIWIFCLIDGSGWSDDTEPGYVRVHVLHIYFGIANKASHVLPYPYLDYSALH